MLIKGTSHSDQLWATNLADQIYGRQGDDVVYGFDGDDLLVGGTGNDFLLGDSGNDQMQGGIGNDQIFDRESGADFLLGGKGDDRLYGDAIDYQRDTLHGGEGADGVFGGTGFDLMIGGDGDDTVAGMGGEYYGDAAPGVRSLAAGNDHIFTDLASDYGTPRIMTGGLGRDTFYVTANAEGVATAVTITDFHNGDDHLAFQQYAWNGDIPDVHLDRNRDSRLDANDGWSADGNVSYDPGANSLLLTVGDGDSIRFLGTDHVDYLL